MARYNIENLGEYDIDIKIDDVSASLNERGSMAGPAQVTR